MTGLNPDGLGRNRSFESVETEDASVSRQLNFDTSEFNPHPKRQFEADAPLLLEPHPFADNPVLTADDTSADYPNARGVADPFIVHEDGTYYIFCEVIPDDQVTDLVYFSSPGGLSWSYEGVLLDDDNRSSYPFTFKWDGTWYLMPDRSVAGFGGEIYKFDPFPSNITKVVSHTESGLPGDAKDPTPFYWPEDENWYCFNGNNSASKLRLHYSEDEWPCTNWTEHPDSPFTNHQLPGGRPLVRDGYVEMYERGVDVVRYHDLSTTNVTRTLILDNMIQSTNAGWNEDYMHHIDAMMPRHANGVAVVDGRPPESELQGNYSIGLYQPTDNPTNYARGVLGSTQTVSSGSSGAKINFDTTDKQAGAYINVANGNFVPRFSGWYRFDLCIELGNFGGGVTTPFTIDYIAKNTEQYPAIQGSYEVNTTNQQTITDSGVAYINSGGFLSARVTQESGGSIDLLSGTDTRIDITRVR